MKLLDARELMTPFGNVLDIYTLVEDGGQLLASQLTTDFPNLIFSSDQIGTIDEYLAAIFADDQEDYGDFLKYPVDQLARQDQEKQEELTSLQLTWDEFVQEIKYTNRFHISNVLNLARLEQLFRTIGIALTPGKILYRGRISGVDGYPDNEMWNPPQNKAVGGRANPLGISYLYLANDLQTTLAETRAAVHDYVAVAQFRVTRALEIVDLKVIGNLDPFEVADKEQLDTYLCFLPFLKKLSSELSKPNRTTDSELDYIPTQYLTEFIKSLEFDGIGYGSSMHPGGHNYAFFDCSPFQFVRNDIYEITSTDYVSRLVPQLGQVEATDN